MDEIVVTRRPSRRPTHPGAVLRKTVLPAVGLTVTEVAARLHVTRQQLHRVLSEQSGISPEMALRLGKFCGNGSSLWMRMQAAFDLWEAERKVGADVATIVTVQPPRPTAPPVPPAPPSTVP